MAFVTGTATFTNGSRAVTVTSGDSTAFFVDETAVFVGTSPIRLVEAVRGSTATTFNLRVNWPHPTVTATFVAFNTYEGLASTIQRVEALGESIQNANAQLSAAASIFASTALGLAATANGDLFSVAGTGDVYTILYRNDNGVATELNRLSSASAITSSVMATAADAVATAADRVQTGLDATATAADRVQTGLDATATAADRVQTGQDRTQTGLDATATAADRVQTGLDVTAAQAARTGAETARTGSETAQTASESARDISLANANFLGPWSSLTGTVNRPASVRHQPSGGSDQIWMLNIATIADVTTSEPGSTGNTDWFSIGVIGTTAPDSNALGGVPATTLIPLIYAGL